MRQLILAALGCLWVGCATMHPRANAEAFRFEPFGEVGAAHQTSVDFKKAMAAAFENMEPAQVAGLAKSVTLLDKEMPPGLEVKDGVIKATPESGLEVVGAFHFVPAFGTSAWFEDYTSVGRKILCYPQVPLTWATLLMWQVFVPISWPCVARGTVPLEQGYGYLRAAAAALDAQFVVLTVNGKDDETFWNAEGFIVRKKSDTPTPKPGSTPNSI